MDDFESGCSGEEFGWEESCGDGHLPGRGEMEVVLRSRRQRRRGQGVEGYPAATNKELYFAILNSEANEGLSILRTRWLCSYISQEASRRESRLRHQGARSGRQGVNLMTLAKEEMFQEIYQDRPGHACDVSKNSKGWEDLSRILERGSRWAELEAAFGPGIFALLGYSHLTNGFIEKTLRADQVKIWVDLLSHRHPRLKEFCSTIKPIFQACVNGDDPPIEVLGLETVSNWNIISRGETVQGLLEFTRVPSPEL